MNFWPETSFSPVVDTIFFLYLKPKLFKVLGELAHEADLFADAKGVFPCVFQRGIIKVKV